MGQAASIPTNTPPVSYPPGLRKILTTGIDNKKNLLGYVMMFGHNMS